MADISHSGELYFKGIVLKIQWSVLYLHLLFIYEAVIWTWPTYSS